MLFSKLFLKNRIVLEGTAIDGEGQGDESFSCLVYGGSVDEDELAYWERELAPVNSCKTVRERLASREWLMVNSRVDDELAGFYWILRPLSQRLWHDKFWVKPGEALLCNAFVKPEFRGRGIYRALIFSAHRHLVNEGILRIITIVENGNRSSMRANVTCGLRKIGRNYLVKFLGINVASVYLWDQIRPRWTIVPGLPLWNRNRVRK